MINSKQNELNYNAAVLTPSWYYFTSRVAGELKTSSGEFSPTQRFYYLQSGVMLQKCVKLSLKRFELRRYEVTLKKKSQNERNPFKLMTHFPLKNVHRSIPLVFEIISSRKADRE